MDSMVQTVSVRAKPVHRATCWDSIRSEWFEFTRWDEWSRTWGVMHTSIRALWSMIGWCVQSTSFFILHPQVAYTMTNSDGTSFGSGTLKITDDTDSLMTLDTLMSSCVSQLNGEYQRLRNITSSHQEAIAWTAGKVWAIWRHGLPMLTLLISSSRWVLRIWVYPWWLMRINEVDHLVHCIPKDSV